MDALTSEQMREADRIAAEEFGISLLQLMEMAGSGVARLCSNILKNIEKSKILIAAGKGNNGGDGLVAARYLKNWGARPFVILSSSDNNDTLNSQINIAEHAGIGCFFYNEVDMIKEIKNSEIVIDALLGYGIEGKPRGAVKLIIESINSHAKRVLSVDVPSGLDATSGYAHSPCVTANATATLAIPKKGLLTETAGEFIGSLYLIDIGIPPDIYAKFGISSRKIGKLFSRNSIIRVI